jgi:hypothetical protein
MQEDQQTADQPQSESQLPAVPPKPKAALEAQAAGVLPILPTTIEEAQRYASGLIQAGIVPDAFKYSSKEAAKVEGAREGDINAPLVLMGVLKAMELGVAPQTGLAGLLPLNGRFSVWGDLAVGLVQREGLIDKQTKAHVGPAFDPSLPLGEWPDDYGYVVSYWRKGQAEPYVGRFTIRDAKRANLWMNQYKKPWIMYPDRMLFNRARAFALRDGFADALGGLSIAEEVMDALPTVEEERAVETKRLSALIDDEPETAPETPQEPQEAQGPEAPADAAEAPQQPENGPGGDESPQPSLV